MIMDEMVTIEDFMKALNVIGQSESGKTVGKFLSQSYVDTTALDTSVELTYFRLGQKELIQTLIKDAKTPYKEINQGDYNE